MRWHLTGIGLLCLLLGCARTQVQPTDFRSLQTLPPRTNTLPEPPRTAPPRAIVTPSYEVTARIIFVNRNGFVVISYPLGGLPASGTRLFGYRKGFKVSELRVTGPQRENNTVADIVVGDCQVGDEVKPN